MSPCKYRVNDHACYGRVIHRAPPWQPLGALKGHDVYIFFCTGCGSTTYVIH